jgi:hypothetical protein
VSPVRVVDAPGFLWNHFRDIRPYRQQIEGRARRGDNMIEHIHHGARIACASVVLLLAACGGGGGGGGGGTDLSTAPGLALSPTSLSFTAVQNGGLPSTQVLQITITNPNAFGIIAGFPTGVPPPTWFDQNSSFSCTPSLTFCTLVAAISTTSLAPGTYSTTLRFVIGDVNQQALALRDLPISYTITSAPLAAIPNSLGFSFITGGTPPAAQPVLLTGIAGSWTASADQPWISVPSSGSGGLVNIGVNTTGLAPNTYNGTVTFNSGGHAAPVPVSLIVAAPGIQTNQASLSFSGINGATIASQSLDITMNTGAALSWTATTPLPDTWLVLDRTSGTQTDSLGVSVNPAFGPLASGVYNSSITLQGNSGGSPFNKTVNVTLTLTKATLTPSPSTVTLGGTNGRDFSGVPVQLSLNTGANSFSWNSNGTAAFVKPSPTSGSVSGAPVPVTLTPDPAGLTGGTHSGTAKFTAAVNGDQVTASVSVTFNQESHKLLVDGNGVAFVKTPGLGVLGRTLTVRDNLSLTTPWTATSDQTWLTVVTPSGNAGDNLTLSADPSTLTTDSLNLATVTIISSDTSVENTEHVRVGLWVGSTDPAAQTPVSVTTANVAADPIRPYAYAAVGSDIRVYNVYTGSLVNTISGVAAGGGTVGFMIPSHDGTTLYALDVTNSKIVRVDLDTQTVGTSFSVSLINPIKIIDYTRTNGVEVIVSGGGGQIFDAQSSGLLGSGFAGNTVVTASRGGTRMCTVNTGSSPYSISCPTLDFTSLNGGQLLVGNTFEVSAGSGGSFGNDVELSANGATLYVASGAVSELSAYSTSGQNPVYAGAGNSPHPTGLHPGNAEIAADGRIFASAANPVFDPADVWVFSALGAPITTYKIAAGGIDQIFVRQLRISGDGVRMITITGDPFTPPFNGSTLNFTTVGP